MECLLTIVFVALLTGIATSQAPEVVTRFEPLYPPIAKAAHVSGTVVLEVTTDANGNVKSTKTISGPAMLVGAAQDSVRHWKFKQTFADGSAVNSPFRISVPFTLPFAVPGDEPTAKEYFPALDTCHTAMRNPADVDAAAKACSHAAEIATHFSTSERFVERRSAYTYAASARIRAKRYADSLDFANRAVDVVKQGHDDGSGSNAAYAVRAQAEAILGNLAAADADFTTAEQFERMAIQSLQKDAPDLVKHEYVPALRNQLLFHAKVLVALNHPEAAHALEVEAAKL